MGVHSRSDYFTWFAFRKTTEQSRHVNGMALGPIVKNEVRVAAANAKIGVARAAYFPDISLGIAGGFESDKISPWFAGPEEMWSLGPTLAQTLFDGGLRRAKTAEARAIGTVQRGLSVGRNQGDPASGRQPRA